MGISLSCVVLALALALAPVCAPMGTEKPVNLSSEPRRLAVLLRLLGMLLPLLPPPPPTAPAPPAPAPEPEPGPTMTKLLRPGLGSCCCCEGEDPTVIDREAGGDNAALPLLPR